MPGKDSETCERARKYRIETNGHFFRVSEQYNRFKYPWSQPEPYWSSVWGLKDEMTREEAETALKILEIRSRPWSAASPSAQGYRSDKCAYCGRKGLKKRCEGCGAPA